MDDSKKLLDEFKDLLPIDDNKYDQLTGDGLNGYRLQAAMSGNVTLAKNGINVLSLEGDNKSEIMQELNTYKKKRFGFFGGNRKSKKSKKSKSKKSQSRKSKSRKNRRKSNRRR